MSIGISDEHVELAASLRKWAASLGGAEVARAAEGDAEATFADTWKAVTEMGIATIALPEAAGGGGGSVLDQAVALEASGHELVPGPLLGPVIAASLLAETTGVAEAIGAGAVVGLGLSNDAVWDAPSATHLLVSNEADEWFVVPADAAAVAPSVGIDLSRRFGSAEFEPAAPDVIRVPGLTRDLARRAAVTYAAAEASGIARWCLDSAVEYAKVREQFGKPIGSFQAVKHLCAEMLETSESVTAAAWDVASVAFGDDEQWAFAADVAAAVAFEGAVSVAKSCIQVLGGIGFTYEHDAHLYYRRAKTCELFLGDPTYHRELIATSLGI